MAAIKSLADSFETHHNCGFFYAGYFLMKKVSQLRDQATATKLLVIDIRGIRRLMVPIFIRAINLPEPIIIVEACGNPKEVLWGYFDQELSLETY